MVKTFLRPEMLERFLESAGNYQKGHNVRFAEILIGDDSDEENLADTEKVINNLRKKYPQLNINYQKYEFYIGCSEGRNRLIDSIKTRYFLYCDDDYVFDNNCDFSEAIDLLIDKEVDLLSGWWKNYKDLGSDYHVTNFIGYFYLHEGAVTCMIYNNYTPHFCYADYHTNFYIAKTEKIRHINVF